LSKRTVSPHLKKKFKDALIFTAATAFIILLIAWPIHGLMTGYWASME
jgi:hypothetical protein